MLDQGAVGKLNSHSEIAPFGALNMPLLDGSMHPIVIKSICKWSKLSIEK